MNLTESTRQLIVQARAKLHDAYEQIAAIEPHRLLGKTAINLNNLKNRVNAAIQTIINNCRMKLTAQANLLTGLNPKSVLQRGYSITTNKKTGSLIKSPADVQIEDDIITELANENTIESKVTKK